MKNGRQIKNKLEKHYVNFFREQHRFKAGILIVIFPKVVSLVKAAGETVNGVSPEDGSVRLM
jgi:hypothetical protein